MSEWIPGSEVARGATAVITRGAPGTVVKTFNADLPRIAVALEVAGTQAAMAAGLPCAELLAADVDGNPPSLTFAFVEGEPLAHRIASAGAGEVGRVLADLQHQVRSIANPQAIPIEEFLGFQLAQAPLPEPLRAAAQHDLARLTGSAERVLCHMDLHDMNVLWSGRGKEARPVLIDWTNAAAGPPEADVARTRMLIANEKYYVQDEQSGLAGMAAATHLNRLLTAFIDRTEQLVPGLVGASRAWDRVIAAARLDERPPAAERDAILSRFAR